MSGQLRSRPETLGQVSGRPGSGSVRLGPPLGTGQLIREWEISELRGHGLEQRVVDAGIQVEGLVHRVHDFPGGAFNDTAIVLPDLSLLPPDRIATGQITSFADGITYWVCADAPLFTEVEALRLIGSRCWLRQTQSFSKLVPDASLSFTITSAFVETTDINSPDRVPGCPPEVADDGPFCDVLKGELHLDVHAFTVPADTDPGSDTLPFGTFFRVAGGATGGGFQGHWGSRIWTDGTSQFPLWHEEPRSTAGSGIDFDFILDAVIPDGPHRTGPESRWLINLRQPLTFTIDLSSLALGQAFTLQTVAVATAYNRIELYPTPWIEFESSASAGLMDPLGIGGTEIAFSGLEPIEVPGISFGEGGIFLTDSPVEPAPCLSESAIDAGSLQFSADHYTITESNPTPVITVIRSGGTTGAVTATITTSDGTAVAGTDYTPVHASVFFADGDNTPRAVVVPVLPNEVSGQVDRTVTITLSDPGGCATLGSPSTTELTIRDDDPVPPVVVVQHYTLDPTFGTGGKATSPRFGGSGSAMALQPDGKIVMAGGPSRGPVRSFILARFDVNGTLDDSFGTGGAVTTDTGVQQEAYGVAIQADGKIVVAGYTGSVPQEVSVARYLADGRLDETFGTGGFVTGIATGQGRDVTIQPDGRIVIAGEATVVDPRGDDFGDLFVAQLLADGQPDLSFGVAGQVVTDVGGLSNEARNVVVQPADGMIVISGDSQYPDSSDYHTDIARYQPDGQLDPTFGTGGTLTLDANVGADLAIQPDGRLLLVGTADTTPPDAPPGSVTELSVMRLEPNGSLDETFGDHGTVNVPVTELSSSTSETRQDQGSAIALQPDGRIVIAGTTDAGFARDFAIVRLLPDGTLDTDFTSIGVMNIDFSFLNDRAENVAVTDNGSIVVSGVAERAGLDSYGVVRLIPLDTGPTNS